MIGVGIIGTGFGESVHIPALLTVRGAKVIGVASRRYERALQTAAKFGLPRAFRSWREMIESPAIQAVTIATPPSSHEEIVLAASASRKAMLCEKPFALNAPQAARMLRAARSAQVIHQIGFLYREIPAMRFARSLLKKNTLGRLRHVRIHWITQGGANPKRTWTWRSDRAQGGGILQSRGVHVFDYIEWLLGSIQSLAAHPSILVDKRVDSSGAHRPVTGADFCQLLLRLRDATPVNVILSSVAAQGKGHWIEFYGDKEVMAIGSDDRRDYEKGFKVLIGAPGSTKFQQQRLPRSFEFERNFKTPGAAPFRRLAQRFINAIRQKEEETLPSFQDGFRAQMLVDLALRADKEKRWLDVPVS